MKVALTGQIAGGKSTVLKILSSYGWLPIATDKLAAEITASAEAQEWLRPYLGSDFDRAALRKKFLKEPEFKKAWEDFLHPRIRACWQALIAQNPSANWVVELPLLYENRLEGLFNTVVVCTCNEACAAARWEAKGRSKDDFFELSKLLIPLEEKLSRADFVLKNNTSIDDLRAQVALLHTKLIYGQRI